MFKSSKRTCQIYLVYVGKCNLHYTCNFRKTALWYQVKCLDKRQTRIMQPFEFRNGILAINKIHTEYLIILYNMNQTIICSHSKAMPNLSYYFFEQVHENPMYPQNLKLT